MKTISSLLLACFAFISLALASPLRAEAEKRIAFVVGNAAYQVGPLATPANDAGLIAQTLQAAGFDVAGARDLDGEALRAAFRDFLDKAQASGPDTVAFVYLSGYGAQLDGENYFVPVDANIAAAPDVAVEALRVSDYTKRLAGLALKASFIVLDGARVSPFAKSGQPLAGGLALADAEPNMLMAFNAAPGTAAPAESGPYGAYARALAEMIREGGLSPSEVFDGVRLRVNEATKGAQVPWDTSRIATPFVFFERAPDAPPPALAQERVNAMRSRPLRDLGAQDAYAAVVERDTLQGYEEFLADYPTDPLANRIRALVAARREAMTWRRTCLVDTPDAYWSYLDRYPRGPHAAGARRRLAALAAPEEPPPSYSPIVYDVPPPPPAEIVYVDRPVLVFDDPEFGFVPPPPIVFLAPPPVYLVSFFFLPPQPPDEIFVLPVPVFVPVPVWINPPAYVVPPPENVIFANIHNTPIINNNGTVIHPDREHVPLAPGPPAAVGAGAGAAAAIAARVALPPSVARKATTIGDRNPGSLGINPGQPAPGAFTGQPGPLPSTRLPAGHALPGANGKPLPGPGEQPVAPTQQKPQPALPGALQNPQGAPLQNNPPATHALPGANGKPLPGLNEKPTGPSQQKPQQALPGGLPRNPLGAPPQNNPPATHALPSGQQLPPLPRGHAAPGDVKPGRTTPPKVLPPPGQQPLNKPPAGQVPPQNGRAPSGPNGKPVVTGPSPTIVPKPQQPQQPPRQPQQSRQPQPAYQPPRAPPPQPQQSRQPQPAYQPPRAPPQQQQKQTCGLPGLPPCH
ncbi:MAG: caspase family protein [Pseudomonadota bacterium]|nr:caspase family protein [Pseudomonadota bacterium]